MTHTLRSWRTAVMLILTIAAARVDAQTRLVRDLRPGPDSSYPSALTRLGDVLLFIADDGEHGSELWRSDGTTAGTQMVTDLNPGPGDAFFYYGPLVVLGNQAFFAGDDGRHGAQLWRSDGTAGGTVLVKEVAAGDPSAMVRNLVAADGTLYFTVATGFYTQEGAPNGHDTLWKSDGTAAGTVAVTDLGLYIPGGFGELKRVDDLYPLNGMLFATVFDGTECCESISLMAVDTSGESHSLFSRYQGGHLLSLRSPHNLTGAGGALFFTIDDGYGDLDCELWRTDGTVAGTLQVAVPQPACGINYLADNAGTLFFTHYEESGTGLRKVSASGLDPTLIKVPVSDGSGYGSIHDLTVAGSTLFFAAEATQRHELWTSDGTAAGTVPLRSFATAPAGSNPSALTDIDGRLVFVADDGRTGPAVWTSDGTADGTVRIGPLPNPPTDLFPNFVKVGNTVFFAARDDAHGAELWALPAHALAGACPSDCDASRSVTVDEVIHGVNIALGLRPLSTCESADVNGDGDITIDELLIGVNRALNGC